MPAPLTNGYRLRPARRGDAPAMVALLAEVGAQADLPTVNWILSHPEMEVTTAADAQDRPIGFISLTHRPLLKMGGRAGTIDELVVAPAWRRKGVGRELLRKVVERARVLSVKRLEVQSFDEPIETVEAFFKASGFFRVNVGVFRLP